MPCVLLVPSAIDKETLAHGEAMEKDQPNGRKPFMRARDASDFGSDPAQSRFVGCSKLLHYRETHELIPTETGTQIRYTMDQVVDGEGNRHEEVEPPLIEFLSGFWPSAFDEMERMVQAAE